jgi:Flp pilus assembly protein TadG
MNRRKGNAVLEFALAATVLLPLLGGTFNIGYGLYSYNKLQSAVRAGGRYASLRSYDSSTGTPSSAFETAVKNLVVYGDPDGGATPVVPGLQAGHVTLSVSMNGTMPANMTVAISGLPIYTVFKTLVLSGKPSATFTYGGHYTAGY